MSLIRGVEIIKGQGNALLIDSDKKFVEFILLYNFTRSCAEIIRIFARINNLTGGDYFLSIPPNASVL